MRKKSILMVLLALAVATATTSAQDTSKVRKYQTEQDDSDDDDIPIEQAPKHTKHVAIKEPPIRMGFKAGLTESTFLYGGDASGEHIGPAIGTVVDLHLFRKLFFETGVVYSETGASNLIRIDRNNGQYISGYYTWNINTIKVPLIMHVKTGYPDNARFVIGIGPYVGWNISGNESGNDLRIGSSDDDDIKFMELGLAIELGLQLRNGLFFHLQSDVGISDMQPKTETFVVKDIRSQSLNFEIGYLFGKTKRYKAHSSDNYVERKL